MVTVTWQRPDGGISQLTVERPQLETLRRGIALTGGAVISEAEKAGTACAH